MNYAAYSYAPFFYQALGTIRTIHAKNYDDTVELAEPQSLSAAAPDLELVWHSAASVLLRSRYPELSACDGRIKQVRAMFETLHNYVMSGPIDFKCINSPANLDALLVSHVAFESISRFLAVEGEFASPNYDTAQVENLMADTKAASELLLETYRILRSLNSQGANVLE